jgi:hypothetical protein
MLMLMSVRDVVSTPKCLLPDHRKVNRSLIKWCWHSSLWLPLMWARVVEQEVYGVLLFVLKYDVCLGCSLDLESVTLPS